MKNYPTTAKELERMYPKVYSHFYRKEDEQLAFDPIECPLDRTALQQLITQMPTRKTHTSVAMAIRLHSLPKGFRKSVVGQFLSNPQLAHDLANLQKEYDSQLPAGFRLCTPQGRPALTNDPGNNAANAATHVKVAICDKPNLAETQSHKGEDHQKSLGQESSQESLKACDNEGPSKEVSADECSTSIVPWAKKKLDVDKMADDLLAFRKEAKAAKEEIRIAKRPAAAVAPAAAPEKRQPRLPQSTK